MRNPGSDLVIYMIRIVTNDPCEYRYCMGIDAAGQAHFGPLGCACFWLHRPDAEWALAKARGTRPGAYIVALIGGA